MKIILDLDGWQKKIDIPRHIIMSGFIDYEICPHLSILYPGKEMVSKPETKKITFRFNGDREDEIPIFAT